MRTVVLVGSIVLSACGDSAAVDHTNELLRRRMWFETKQSTLYAFFPIVSYVDLSLYCVSNEDGRITSYRVTAMYICDQDKWCVTPVASSLPRLKNVAFG